MSETFTFETIGNNKETGGQAKFKLTVKKEFLEKCPNPHEFEPHDLNVKFYMFKFLHNENGPAIIRTDIVNPNIPEAKQNLTRIGKDRCEFWIDGRLMNSEDGAKAAKMLHDYQFGNKLEDVLNDS